jgi:hypothetical protein
VGPTLRRDRSVAGQNASINPANQVGSLTQVKFERAARESPRHSSDIFCRPIDAENVLSAEKTSAPGQQIREIGCQANGPGVAICRRMHSSLRLKAIGRSTHWRWLFAAVLVAASAGCDDFCYLGAPYQGLECQTSGSGTAQETSPAPVSWPVNAGGGYRQCADTCNGIYFEVEFGEDVCAIQVTVLDGTTPTTVALQAEDVTCTSTDNLAFISGALDVLDATDSTFHLKFSLELQSASSRTVRITDGTAAVDHCHQATMCKELPG